MQALGAFIVKSEPVHGHGNVFGEANSRTKITCFPLKDCFCSSLRQSMMIDGLMRAALIVDVPTVHFRVLTRKFCVAVVCFRAARNLVIS